MWLFNAVTHKLELFHDLRAIAYAILSHIWGEEEVTFKDMQKGRHSHLKGFDKIDECCKQALSDGFTYVWVDTCCIDKRSSAELSEAINNMYKW